MGEVRGAGCGGGSPDSEREVCVRAQRLGTVCNTVPPPAQDFLLQVCEAVKMRFFTVNAQTVAALAWALANSKVGQQRRFRAEGGGRAGSRGGGHRRPSLMATCTDLTAKQRSASHQPWAITAPSCPM